MLSLDETRDYLRRARVHLGRAKEVADGPVPPEVQASVLALSVEIHLRAIDRLSQGLPPLAGDAVAEA